MLLSGSANILGSRAGHRSSGRDALTRDRAETPRERRRFSSARRAEESYARRLREVARQVGKIVEAFEPDDPEMWATLHRYAELLRPWARAVGNRMLADVSRRDEAVWASMGAGMARALRTEIRGAPTGQMLRDLLAGQVELITSLPLVAARRVHRLTLRGLETSQRAATVAEEIMRTGEVTRGRANLIARTETSRTASMLTMARAEYVGSEGYIWRTVGDSDVRRSHRKMNGKFVSWKDPPTLDGMTGHAGALPNCRCYPEPVIPEEIE